MERKVMEMKYGKDIVVHLITEGRSRSYKAFLPGDIIYHSKDLEWVLRKIKHFRNV